MEGVPADSALSWEFSSADATAASKRRRDFGSFLRRYGTPDSDYEAAEVIFGELVANVVQHAPGAIRILVEWQGTNATLHVFDRGRGFSWQPALPHDPLCESQRGLFIIARLSAQVRVRCRANSGTRVSVLLPVARQVSTTITCP